MDHERFDELAKTLSSGASRRKMIGGAIAGLVGAGIARVSGADAKGGKKGRKKKVGKEYVCIGFGPFDNDDCPFGSCCSSTPAGNDKACVRATSQLGSQICGHGFNGNGICRTCPPGTKCGRRGNGEFDCICDPTSCPNGCCINNFGFGAPDLCVQNGSGQPVSTENGDFDGQYVCGTGGSTCNVCGLGTVFSGCCTATGACSAGTSNNNCGSSGELCQVCQNDSSCGVDQACTGGTTTTTTTTPGPCADGRPRCTTGGLSVCCDAGFVCTGSGCARKKKKKKKKKHHKKH